MKYKGYALGRYDKQNELFSHIDMYEMTTLRYPLHRSNYEYYWKQHPNEKPAVLVDPKQVLMLLKELKTWTELGTEYCSCEKYYNSTV
jgi:hypothetical protein